MRLEHALFPSRPIYLVGDSFGGCVALAVAARNPAIDLVLVLVNPGQCQYELVTALPSFFLIYGYDIPCVDEFLLPSFHLATSFGKSYLQPLLPILDALPDELHVTVCYLLSLIMGNMIFVFKPFDIHLFICKVNEFICLN